jgi:hypothetical protein
MASHSRRLIFLLVENPAICQLSYEVNEFVLEQFVIFSGYLHAVFIEVTSKQENFEVKISQKE